MFTASPQSPGARTPDALLGQARLSHLFGGSNVYVERQLSKLGSVSLKLRQQIFEALLHDDRAGQKEQINTCHDATLCPHRHREKLSEHTVLPSSTTRLLPGAQSMRSFFASLGDEWPGGAGDPAHAATLLADAPGASLPLSAKEHGRLAAWPLGRLAAWRCAQQGI